MAVPNLAPGYLGQRKSAIDQRQENERQRAFEKSQASTNFLRKLGGDVLGAALNIGGDIAGSAFRDSLTKDERSAAAGTYYPGDDVMGDQGAAIRQVAESRAATELRPQASFGGAVESGYGRRGIDTGVSPLGGAKAAAVLNPQSSLVQPAVTPLVQQLRASEPVKRPEYATAFDAPGLAPRGMESEAPRRPIAAPPSPVAQRPAPIAQPREMRSPEVYAPPRMMPSTAAAMARETGYRDAIPSMPTSVRGLAQQAQDVRDERALGLELQRKKLLWDEQQATANVQMMQERGASATAIAAARAKEADAKAKAEEMRQLDLLMSARSRGAPKYVRGLGVYTPPQTVLPTGNTDDGLRGDIVPQGPMGRQGGAGRGRGGAGAGDDAPTGDIIIVVEQTRDRNGNPLGVSQPRTYQESPAFWERYVRNPVDAGMNSKEAGEYRAAFRQYKAALPAAYKGDAAAQEAVTKAQNAMRTSFMAGQSRYKPAVAEGREAVATSPKDVATEQNRNDIAELRRQIDAQKDTAGRTRRVGSTVQEVATLAEPSTVTADEVTSLVMDSGVAIPGARGRFMVDDGSELERNEFEAAVRGLPPPADMDPGAMAAYRKVADAAKTAKDKRLTDKEALRARRLEGIAMELEAEGEADPFAYLENRAGVVLPASIKAKARTPSAPAPTPARPQAPAQPAAPARASTTPKFATLEDASDWVRTKPWPSDVKRATLQAIQSEQGL